MNAAIIVAAGKSERMGPQVDKAFLSLGTKPVLAYCLMAFEQCPDIDGVILVVRKDRLEGARAMVQMFGCSKVRRVLPGGSSRQASVMNGMEALWDEVTTVAVHDGARPCIKPEVISATVKSAKRYGSGVSAVKATDTVKLVEQGLKVVRTLDRAKIWTVQTPQTFEVGLLRKAFDAVRRKRVTVTDEASAVELVSKEVRLVPGDPANIKITTPDDLRLAAALLKI
jgi:2-C-methyl-D-erythritol 4-phosphate cytidylyltransferase